MGQNFLTNLDVARKIADAGDIHNTDTVLEIGPGKGVLTQELLVRAEKVIAVEKDDELVALLRKHFSKEIAEGRLVLHHGDILDVLEKRKKKKERRSEQRSEGASPSGMPPSSSFLLPSSYCVVANIPYNITGAIIEGALSSPTPPERMVLLVQREVAERIVTRDHKESLLSIAVNCYGTPRIAGYVSAGNFSPKPKVDSAILAIENISKGFFLHLATRSLSEGIREMARIEDDFFTLVRAGFAHKRKYLLSNLRSAFGGDVAWSDVFEKVGLPATVRAEKLTPLQWRELFVHTTRLT